MSQTETWTVKRLLEWTTDFLKKKEIESPRLEAEILLAGAMNLKRIELYTNFEREPDDSQRTRFRELVKRRGAGEPVAYLVGFKEFYSLSFKVDRNVLIPRPETERLVLEAIDFLKTFAAGTAPALCDVGTGSGAIAVALAKNRPKTPGPGRIVAVDLSEEALNVAKENAAKHAVAEKISFQKSDLLESVDGSFDLIVSNPPYVSQAEYDSLPKDVKNFEPKSALLAGPKGTEIVQKLVEQAIPKLKPGGCLLVEGSPMIAAEMFRLFSGLNEVRIIRDDAGLERFAVGKK